MLKRDAQNTKDRKLPVSHMAYPRQLSHKFKYYFWRAFTPLHPRLRDIALRLRLIWHVPGRQNFHIGYVAPDVSTEEVVDFLIEKGYGNHFIAWHDDDEILSLRRTDEFEYQYHLRIFADGEIRGHFEYTPECYPILHMKEIGMEERNEYFWELLGGKIIRKTA